MCQRLVPLALLLLGTFAFPLALLAQVDVERGVYTSGDIRDSRIMIGGVPPEQLPGIIEAATEPLRELTIVLQATIADLKHQLGANQSQLHVFFQTVGEEDVAPKRIGSKLVEIARHHRNLDDLDAAAATAQRANIALTGLRYRDAARLFSRAAAQVPQDHDQQRMDYLQRQADALHRQGDEKRDNAALKEAVHAYEALVAQCPRERMPLQWATIQNSLGNVFWIIGKRESGTARLEEARKHIENSWRVFDDAGMDQYDDYFRHRLDEIDHLVKTRREGGLADP